MSQLYNFIVYSQKFSYYNSTMKPYNRTEHIRQMNLSRFHHALDKWKVWRQPWDDVLKEAWQNTTRLTSHEDCWIWARKLSPRGQAMFQIKHEITGDEKTVSARRFAYELVFGTKLEYTDWLCDYICNNPQCVNPFHAIRTTSSHRTRDILDSLARRSGYIKALEDDPLLKEREENEKYKREQAYRNRVNNVTRK